jgi:DNA polymerase-3 subunit beta
MLATATDGHRLVRRIAPRPATTGDADPKGYIVPTAAIKQIVDMTSGEGQIRVTLSAASIYVERDRVAFSSALVDGTYPDIERVVPKGREKSATFKPGDLLDALERGAAVYAAADIKMPAVVVSASPEALTVSVNTDAGDSGTEQINAEIHDRDCKFKVATRYLADCIKLWPDVEVSVCVTGPSHPVLFISDACPEMLQVIMPVR